jgi:alpha-tubulin suppressor-like RCC1 family protein
MPIDTGYKDTDGVDLGRKLVEQEYLITTYPDLFFSEKSAGLWTWGLNGSGRLGDNTIIDKSSPVQTVAGGTNWKYVGNSFHNFTAAIKTDGTLWMWGSNAQGSLGDNSVIEKSSPVQTVAGGTNWKEVGCGFYYSGAIKTDGTLWMWGNAARMGDGVGIHRSSPTQTISGGTNWKHISCGGQHVAAIKTDGTLWLWSNDGNAYGQLGDNTVVGKNSPIQTVAGGTNWKQVSCGYYFTAAIKTDGTLWMWGDGTSGMLGDNTITSKSSPQQTICGGTNWKQVSCGASSTAAIKTDGTLWTWGNNINGQLGDNSGSLSPKSSPVQTICGGTNWKQVVSCVGHMGAIKTDGTLWMWGGNSNGRLGDNTVIFRSSPVQTISGGTNWKQVAYGQNNTMAISDFGDI